MMIQNETCIPDFTVSFCREAKQNAGEDSYCHAFCASAGLLGVFDGCGGLGAQRHACYSDRTEAYIASRLAAGAFYDSFREMFPRQGQPHALASAYVDAVSRRCERRFAAYRPEHFDEARRVKGSMVRTLPTTVAAVLVQSAGNGESMLHLIWAGDSRVYLLTPDGLMQLTSDDLSVSDPMENLYEDGILRNTLCADKQPQFRTASLTVRRPFVVFAATDGCFGYFSTPMEFEGVLLETLLAASAPAEWERLLGGRIAAVAGDDDTLCMAAYGFTGFSQLREAFADRFRFLQTNYLQPIRALPPTDRETRRQLWRRYAPQYSRYLRVKNP